MPRYIDADKLKAHYAWWECTESGNELKNVFDTIIDLQPTADVVERKIGKCISGKCVSGKDVVEVVRCKDCKYWDMDWETHKGFHYCPMIDGLTDVDFFCADGERRTDDA